MTNDVSHLTLSFMKYLTNFNLSVDFKHLNKIIITIHLSITFGLKNINYFKKGILV